MNLLWDIFSYLYPTNPISKFLRWKSVIFWLYCTTVLLGCTSTTGFVSSSGSVFWLSFIWFIGRIFIELFNNSLLVVLILLKVLVPELSCIISSTIDENGLLFWTDICSLFWFLNKLEKLLFWLLVFSSSLGALKSKPNKFVLFDGVVFWLFWTKFVFGLGILKFIDEKLLFWLPVWLNELFWLNWLWLELCPSWFWILFWGIFWLFIWGIFWLNWFWILLFWLLSGVTGIFVKNLLPWLLFILSLLFLYFNYSFSLYSNIETSTLFIVSNFLVILSDVIETFSMSLFTVWILLASLSQRSL